MYEKFAYAEELQLLVAFTITPRNYCFVCTFFTKQAVSGELSCTFLFSNDLYLIGIHVSYSSDILNFCFTTKILKVMTINRAAVNRESSVKVPF